MTIPHRPNLQTVLTITFWGVILVLTASSCGSARRLAEKNAKISKVVAASRGYLGTPYRYGGISKSGIDCSGLILQSYKTINLDLPRSSADQSETGKKVKIQQLRPGDLLFFAMGKRRRKITHVGMVTNVTKDKIMFIHASTSAGVVERDLRQEYYMKHFRGARRIIL